MSWFSVSPESIPASFSQSITFDEPGVNAIVSTIRDIASANKVFCRNTIVTICGGSCTGKSTQVAMSLQRKLGNEAQVLSQDNYMFAAFNSVLDPVYRWDHPGLYNLQESFHLMEELRHGRVYRMPQPSLQRQAAEQVNVHPTNIVIFEGLYTGFQTLRDHADFVIYVEMPLYARIVRRLVRNMYERYRNLSPLLILENFLDSPLRAHRDFVIGQKAAADVAVSLKYCFEETIKRFSLTPLSRSLLLIKYIASYRLIVAENFIFEIYEGSDGYYLRLLYKDLVYLDFRIHEGLFLKLLTLDLTSM